MKDALARLVVLTGVLLYPIGTAGVRAQGVLEIPGPNSTQTGIGVIAGWHCNASRIEIAIDGGTPLLAGSRTARGDTLGTCGRTDTGFSLLLNWNLLPIHCFGCRYHRVVALADGVAFADTEFQAENFGIEFMTGKSATYGLANFPAIGSMTWLGWDEAKQNFSVESTAPNELSIAGTYYGALRSGAQNPVCGPFPLNRVLPIKHGSFVVENAGGQLSLTAQFADGTTCRLPSVAPEIFDSKNRDGYVVALFDPAATASCSEFPGGLELRVSGERLVADSRDPCRTAHVMGAK